MPATLPLPQISTNVRLAATRLLFPDLAGACAERLFLTPPVAEHPVASALDLIDARSSFVVHRGRHIATWRWGSRDAPAVLLVHGWGGNAAQMCAFVGLVAGFWHILWIAGVGILAAGLTGVLVHSVGYERLERN